MENLRWLTPFGWVEVGLSPKSGTDFDTMQLLIITPLKIDMSTKKGPFQCPLKRGPFQKGHFILQSTGDTPRVSPATISSSL